MIEVTDRAAAELKTLIEQEEKPELALRIFQSCCRIENTDRTGRET
jgi:Fe-S cluster assembly iron-binding protein IscA